MKRKNEASESSYSMERYFTKLDAINARRSQFTPEELAEQDRQDQVWAERKRAIIWTHWLRLPSWTIEQAVYLVFGIDPDERRSTIRQQSPVEKRSFVSAIHQLKASADAELLPASRALGVPQIRYKAGELLALMIVNEWGHFKQMAAVAVALKINVAVPAAPATSRAKGVLKRRAPTPLEETIPYRRAKFVFEFACQLTNVDPELRREDVWVSSTEKEFIAQLNARHGTTHLAGR